MERDTEILNSPIGLASRKIAFALVEGVAGNEWSHNDCRDVDNLQEAFAKFGTAIAEHKSKELKLKTTPEDIITMDMLVYRLGVDKLTERSWENVKSDLMRLAHKEMSVHDK